MPPCSPRPSVDVSSPSERKSVVLKELPTPIGSGQHVAGFFPWCWNGAIAPCSASDHQMYGAISRRGTPRSIMRISPAFSRLVRLETSASARAANGGPALLHHGASFQRPAQGCWSGGGGGGLLRAPVTARSPRAMTRAAMVWTGQVNAVAAHSGGA
eukprot:COSAG06_NODE_15411_length_1072_cov_2.113052_2_plen_157_part_00